MEMLYFTLSVVSTILFTCVSRPSIKVVPAVIRQSDSVHLTCSWPPMSDVSQCSFCIKPVHLSECVSIQYSESCNLELSGNDLFTLSNQSGIAEIQLRCLYVGTQSQPVYSYPSESSTVIVVGPPQLLVSPQLINETDTGYLTCQTPQSSLVSQCFFLVGGSPVSIVMPSCQLQTTKKDLIHWAGVRPPVQISLSCYYTVTTTPQLSSDPSQPVSITVDSGGSWTTVMVILGVIMFVGGLIIFFLCLKTRRCAFKREDASPVRSVYKSVRMGFRSTNIAPGVMGDQGMALSSTAAVSDTMVTLEPEQGSAVHPVYSSIPDIPIVADQEDCASSVEHVYSQLEPTQDNSIYNVLHNT
ncbi:uncharacterized protein LOC143126171 isoform X2 [Alosa pseudoharengus]|uniref:uncharacterized protein LOC143126171 isoform X2 n=1 Tax=Alosa pseudoharengus TaxID=34774 RepID=UPI003F8BFCFC